MSVAVAYGCLPPGLTYAELCGLFELRHLASYQRTKASSQAVRLGMAAQVETFEGVPE